MIWHHHQVVAEQQRSAEFAAAARQGVVTLMSLDFNHAEDDVKRIIDNTTGDFRKDFESQAPEFTDVAKQSKVVTEATVNAAAVQSMTKDTATVLVAVTTRVSNTASKQQEPRVLAPERRRGARRRTDQAGESRVRTVTTEDQHNVTDADDHRRGNRRILGRRARGDGHRGAHRRHPGRRDPSADEAPTPSAWGLRRLLVPIVLAVLLLSSAGLASWAYLTQFRPDQQTDAAAAAATIKAASDGSIALLSYSPDSLDKDFAAAKTHLTGDFLDYYTQFTHDIVTPAAQQKAVKTSATVVRSAVSDLNPDSAVVLLFLNQTTTSKENPDGSFTASSVKVGLTRVNGAWLISAFDPV